MKYLFLFVMIVLFSTSCNSTKSVDGKTQEIASNYFNEVKTICDNDNGKLLGFKLHSPIILIDESNNTVFANEANKDLNPLNEIFTGTLPKNIEVNESTLIWNNKKWVVIKFPLSNDKHIRIENIVTELVHFKEANIGLNLISKQECSHLREGDNIYWMKMEAEALKMALISNDEESQKEHIRLALAARKLRKLMSINMFQRENDLDLKKGLPILTGILLNNLSYEENSTILYDKLDEFQKSNNIEQTFYKLMLPSYGLVMSKHDMEWLKKIKYNTNILDFIIAHYQFKYLESFTDMVKIIQQKYHKDDFKQVKTQ